MIQINLRSCFCGCGRPSRLKSGWIRGHWNRGQKRTEEQLRNYRAGSGGWNRGLTKQTDERIAVSSSKISKGLQRSYVEGRRQPWNVRIDREQVKRERQAHRFCSNSLHRCLALSGTKKEGHTFELLGYTPKELIEHITSKLKPGMTWGNYGLNGWHIDHVKAMAEFESWDPKIVNALSNLQPLWSRENISKGASTRWTRRKLNSGNIGLFEGDRR